MNSMVKRILSFAAVALSIVAATMLIGGAVRGQSTTSQNRSREAAVRVPVTLTGGYDTDPRDRGRPVALVSAALGVPAEVFRATFRHVTPASGGQEPEPEQVHRNKEALLRGLGPYGVTNERLDTVSDYYRYNAGRGERWRNTPAVAVATIRKGKVIGFTITNPGAGYSSPPQISVPGMPNLKATVTLAFGTDLRTNGSLKAITLDGPSK